MGGVTVRGRRFQVWEYTVSHAQLLLRSVRDEGNPTRIDLLFKNVGFVALPASFDVDSIEELTDDHPVLSGALAREALRGDRRGFMLRSRPQDGVVVAGVMVSAEDELESHEPSALPCWPMRSGSAE